MKHRIKLAETTTSDGSVLALQEHDGEFAIYCNGSELMHSRATDSERLLGELGTERLQQHAPSRVLIGGLGLGFTLRAVLASTSPNTIVDVVELLPELIQWNRTHLQRLNGELLDDPRVVIHTNDVLCLIEQSHPNTYDSIVLDIDNGPVAMVSRTNSGLYSVAGLRAIRAALKPGGRFVVWSASADKAYEERLGGLGLNWRAIPARRHAKAKRPDCLIYVSDDVR
jgi:spermidine synthase